MQTLVVLVRIRTLPQGETMNKVLRGCIPDITMSVLDDIPIKGCPELEKEESFDQDGCRRFVSNHIKDCEKLLHRLEGVGLTFSREKLAFGQKEIIVVGHLCVPYGRKPSLRKVIAIQEMREECETHTEIVYSRLDLASNTRCPFRNTSPEG